MQPKFQTYENLGLSFLYKGSYPEAIKNLQTAITYDDPRVYLGHGELARAYFWAPGQHELARQSYQQAIALARQKLKVNPDDAPVQLMLGVYYSMLRQEHDALYYLDLVRNKMPDDPEAAFWAGVIKLQLGYRPQALALLRQARTLKYSFAEMNAAPELDTLRADPEFQQFMSPDFNSGNFDSNPEPNRRTQ